MLAITVGEGGNAWAQSTNSGSLAETSTDNALPSPIKEAADEPCTNKKEGEAYQKSGEHFLRNGFLVPALDEFRKSFALCPSQMMLFRIGFSELALRNYTRARKAFLSLDETNMATTAQLRNVHQKVGYVSLEITPANATVLVDGRPLEKDAFAPPNRPNTWVAGTAETSTGTSPGAKFVLLADEGFHAITVTKPGYEKAQEQMYVVGGQSDKRTITLKKIEPPKFKFPFNAIANTSGIVAISGGVGALIAGIVANSYTKDANCQDDRCLDKEAYLQAGTAADAATGLTIVSVGTLVIAGFSKYLALQQEKEPRGPNDRASRFDLRVGVSPQAASLGVSYAF